METHWREIEEVTGKSIYPEYDLQSSLEDMVGIGLHEDCEKIEEICLRAMREHSLLLFLGRLEAGWKDEVVEFTVGLGLGTLSMCEC